MSQRPRVIERLRKAFPGTWRWDADSCRWYHEDGWYVYAVSTPTPLFDGDDSTFHTEYHRSVTGVILNLDGFPP